MILKKINKTAFQVKKLLDIIKNNIITLLITIEKEGICTNFTVITYDEMIDFFVNI